MKNIHVFAAILPTINTFQDELSQSLGMSFIPCTNSQASSFGFAANSALVKLENGYKINFSYSFKKLPKGALQDEINLRAEALQAEQGYDINKEQLSELAEAVFAEFCAKVLPETSNYSAYYHEKHETLIFDSTQVLASRALSLICQLLKSVETKALHVSGISNSLTVNMIEQLAVDANQFIEGEPHRSVELKFAGFDCGDILVLKNKHKDVARFKGDYPTSQVKDLLDDGYEIKEINLSKDGVSFTLNDKFKIKSIKTTFEVGEDDFDGDQEQYQLHIEALELELLVSHCITLRDHFDKQVSE